MPQAWADPGYNRVLWIQSPNCDLRPPTAVVDTVVLHATVISTLQGVVERFQSPEHKVSSHYTIGKDGSVVQHVSRFNRAWHAGKSKDVEGRTHVNDFSIGIELVNLNDGKDPYPLPQTTVLRNLIMALRKSLPLRYVTSHEYVAVPPGRKTDPLAYPWKTLENLGLHLVP